MREAENRTLPKVGSATDALVDEMCHSLVEFTM